MISSSYSHAAPYIRRELCYAARTKRAKAWVRKQTEQQHIGSEDAQ